MNKEQGVGQYVNHAIIQLTNRCNFACEHCGQNYEQKLDILPDDFSYALSVLENPFFNNLTIYGGEARIHPQFYELLNRMDLFVHGQGRKFKTEQSDPEKRQLIKVQDTIVDNLKNEMGESKFQRLSKSPEWSGIVLHHMLNQNATEKAFTVDMYTNGYGLKNAESIKNILNTLGALGISMINISTDSPHRQFASNHHIPIDYEWLDDVAKNSEKLMQAGISQNISICVSGIGSYIIPIGRAHNLSWTERVDTTMFGVHNVSDEISRLKAKLRKEFSRWSQTQYKSHCYCNPGNLTGSHNESKKWKPENRINLWTIHIAPDLSVNLCPFSVIPDLGNLKNETPQDLYFHAVSSPLYNILATEGPQGLARAFWNISEPELEEMFLERTPCGLCEDVMTANRQQVESLI
jgi:MoaA/NifB/PqqE/SkfB family radical SAM enzyme